jgi:predicted transposase YdaD
VHPGNAGINKPFDRILKSFADEAPRLFLRLLGFVPAGAVPDIQPLRPETAPAMVLPDYVAVVRIDPGVPIIFHAEFQSNYHHEVPRDMCRYGGSLAWQHQMPVESVLVMLRPKGVPAEIPEVGHYSIGVTHTTHPFKTVRLWEIDPTPVLETNDPRLLPWALLLKSSDEQVRKIASIVAAQEDEEAVGRFLTLGSLRYNRESLYEMLGGGKMGLIRAILDGSSIVQEERDQAAAQGRAEGLAEGEARGRAEGQAQGRAAEGRRVLRLLLRKHFPELESLAEIDGISNVDALESIIESVFDASGADEVRTAILRAAQPN